MASSISKSPLGKTVESDIHHLTQALWSWPVCEACNRGKRCTTNDCPSQRSKRLVRFFDYYKDLTASYEPTVVPSEHVALSTHDDLLKIILELKSKPNTTRGELANNVFGSQPGREGLPSIDQEHAINLAIKVMTMVNCSTQRQSSDLLEHGVNRAPWLSNVTFSQFMMDIFPTTDHPSINDDDLGSSLQMRSALMAKKLKKHAGLKFHPTDDLRSHLKLDQRTAVVEIFHHTAFLKEHLRLTKDRPRNMSVSDSLKMGALPRQLALEVLDSIQKILFPLSDPKSRSLLLSLISTAFFDPDCLRFESASIRANDEKDIAYHYFGARLTDLYEEMENPKPRGWLEKWLERKSGARYVMMATLVGVAIAIGLGVASLAVSCYQA